MMASPRSISALVVMMLVACSTGGATRPPGTSAPTPPLGLVVFGGRTDVAVFSFDARSGSLGERTRVAMPGRSAYVAVSPDRRFVYAGHGEAPGHVTAFALGSDGGLARLNDESTALGEPAGGISHLSVHPSGRWLLSAHLKSGRISVLPLASDGRVGPPTFTEIFAVGAHQMVLPRSGALAFVPVRDGQFVASFKVDAEAGRLAANDRVATAPGAGPRHITFTPDERFAYVNNESNGTVTAYALDTARGTLAPLATVPSVPADFEETGTGHILCHRNGRFVYASNRFHGSIAAYTVDPASGALGLVEIETAGGELKFPRDFDIDPSGHFMVVGNEKGDSLSVLRIDQTTGALAPLGPPVPAPQGPQVVIIL
jgi:6-phosphogluconolactonase (cycloisomerase 2 family)